MANKIFSKVVAMRLFREENFDLVLCAPTVIAAASEQFEKDGDHASANDIHARYDDYQEEMRIMEAEALAEFGY